MAKRMLWAGPYLQGTIPKQAVKDCTAQGRVDESVAYWVKATGFYVPNEDMAREYLVSTGRDPDEIEAAELDSVTAQVFWDACHAVKNGEPFSLVGWPMRCDGCGEEIYSFAGPVCMDCVKARHAAVVRGRCGCRAALRRERSTGNGIRAWVTCDRCLGTVRQLPDPKRKAAH